jgi:hypothetical protein
VNVEPRHISSYVPRASVLINKSAEGPPLEITARHVEELRVSSLLIPSHAGGSGWCTNKALFAKCGTSFLTEIGINQGVLESSVS